MKKLVSLILALSILIGSICVFVACDDTPAEAIDYASQLKLDLSSSRAKIYATVKYYIDGDTTHFTVSDSNSITGHLTPELITAGVLKARYLAIDTPESTGRVEPYGKAASNFTKSKLKAATSIILESDTDTWDTDSTGGRYLTWVWYKTDEMTEYRNLNLEILQAGLAQGSKVSNNSYGQYCMNALSQAMDLKLVVFSGERDPDYFYGEIQVITLKELRTNIEQYTNTRVAVEGVVVSVGNNNIYIQDYDEETQMYYGMTIFDGYSTSVQSVLKMGRRVRVAGSVQFYENGGTYQIADVNYDPFEPDKLDNIKVLEQNVETEYTTIDAARFKGTKNVTLENELGEKKDYDYANLILNTAVKMENLVVKKITTTTKEDSKNKGAMSIYCTATGSDGKTYEITVRTIVLKKSNGDLYVASDIGVGTVLNVSGLVEYYVPDYEGGVPTYQIKVLTFDNLGIQK